MPRPGLADTLRSNLEADKLCSRPDADTLSSNPDMAVNGMNYNCVSR